MTTAPHVAGATVERSSEEWERDVAMRHRYGDQAAFDEVYEEFAPMVYHLALRMSGKPERAEDLSQEVFLRIHKSLGKFQGRSKLKTWVYRVCVNHCRTRLSRKRLDVDSLDREAAAVPVDERRDPEERVLAQDAKARVAHALLGVDRVFREAVILRDLDELSYQEIAEVLRVRIGTVRSRIARGREQLRKALIAQQSESPSSPQGDV